MIEEVAMNGQEAASPRALPTVGLVAPLPPQVGGVPSVAGWLLDNASGIGCTYVTFDLWRPPGGDSGGRVTAEAVRIQAGNLVRFLRWIPCSPHVVHYCVSANRTGLARDLLFLALLRGTGRSAIAHVHGGSDLEQALSSPLYLRALRLLPRLCEAVVAIAPSVTRLLGSLGISATTIMNPVRIEESSPRPLRRPGPLRLLFVGAYGDAKGTSDLVVALAQARARGVHASLRVVGKPQYLHEHAPLSRRITALGVDDAIDFVGILTPDSLRREYRDADLLCLPSRREGLPMVVLEAMACGLPVLASEVGAVPDVVVDGITGVLVQPGDIAALERAIAWFAANPEHRERMGIASKRRVLSVSGAVAVTADWRALYDRLER